MHGSTGMHKADITEWQNAIIQLPERTFFNIIQLYLGEISTPFNKQRLVERLSGFLHKPDIQSLIVQALDRVDILLLTAVNVLPNTTRHALMCFFSFDFSIHARLLNMEERLLLYQVDEEVYGGEKVYKINPLLFPILEPLLDENVFFLPEKKISRQSRMTFVDDIVLAGLYTFFLRDPAVLKKDGSFKRKTVKAFASCFPDIGADTDRIDLVCAALRYLDLCTVSELSFVPQDTRWALFFNQTAFERKMYLAAAACGQARRRTLYNRTVLLSRFFARLDPEAAYTDDTLKQIYYSILQQTYQQSAVLDETIFSEVPHNGKNFMLVEAAKGLGLLVDVDGFWAVNTDIFSEPQEHQPVIAAASFELTVLPQTAIKDVFPLLAYLEPVSIQRTGRFEITRAACARCFERYTDADFFINALQKASGHAVPQNIIVTVTDWYAKYTAIGVYQGVVLCAAEEKRGLFKQNADLQGMIYKELADGVYLLREQDAASIRSVLKNAGLDCTFYYQQKETPATFSAFQSIPYSGSEIRTVSEDYYERMKSQSMREEHYAVYKKSLEAALEKAVEREGFSSEQQRRFAEKIERKLIIYPKQLRKVSIDSDLYGVSALDFLGKMRMVESAISAQTLLEISFDSDNHHRVVIGLPIRIEKSDADAVVTLQIKTTAVYEKISLARISKMNTIRLSLFT